MKTQPTKAQIARIHILRKEKGIEEEIYREMLKTRYNVASSRELTYQQATRLIQDLGGHWEHNPNTSRYQSDPGNREGMASPAQLRMIHALWSEVSYLSDKEARETALDRFLYKRFGCWLRSVPQEKVGPIRKTLLAMQRQNNTPSPGGVA